MGQQSSRNKNDKSAALLGHTKNREHCAISSRMDIESTRKYTTRNIEDEDAENNINQVGLSRFYTGKVHVIEQPTMEHTEQGATNRQNTSHIPTETEPSEKLRLDGEILINTKDKKQNNEIDMMKKTGDNGKFYEESLGSVGEKISTRTGETKPPHCDICISRHMFLSRISFGVYLCFFCKKYFCNGCFTEEHAKHNVIQLNGNIDLNREAYEMFVKDILNETLRREKILGRENISVCARVNVNHDFDKFDSVITGMCGLGIRRWIACDYNNKCIKVFKIGSNELLRYIRFESDTFDVTEVDHPLYRNSHDTVYEGNTSCTGKQLPYRTTLNEKCVLAVTLPWDNLIVLLGMNDYPATKIDNIKTPDQCNGIDYLDRKLLVACRSAIYIMTLNGYVLKKLMLQQHFNRDSTAREILDFTVSPKGIYVVEFKTAKLFTLDFQGGLISKMKMTNFQPSGISLDNHGHILVCAGSVYELDVKNRIPKSIFDDSKVKMTSPYKPMCYRDRLYVSHTCTNTKENVITVVRLI